MIARFLRWLLGVDHGQDEDLGTDGQPEHWLPLVSGKDELLP